ncbi:hypothetical protein BGX28_007381, partial [Mortierella sp. GBA30]
MNQIPEILLSFMKHALSCLFFPAEQSPDIDNSGSLPGAYNDKKQHAMTSAHHAESKKQPKAREEQPAPKQEARTPLSTIVPYNKEYRKQKKSRAARHDPGHESDDSGYSADVSSEDEGHSRRDRTDRILKHSPRHSYSHLNPHADDYQVPSRRRHGGLQVRSQVTPKRHVRSIPGRFSALDTDEEREAVRKLEMEKAQRLVQGEASGAQGAANGLQVMLRSDAPRQGEQQCQHGQTGYHETLNHRQLPQAYSALNYGRRSKLYHPKLDEMIARTSSGPPKPIILETWRCRSCGHRPTVEFSKCGHCGAPKPGPLVLNTTPIAELLAAQNTPEPDEGNKQDKKKLGVSGWALAGIMMPDMRNKWRCPTCYVTTDYSASRCPCCWTAKPGENAVDSIKAPAIPAIFVPPAPTSAPLTAAAATSAPFSGASSPTVPVSSSVPAVSISTLASTAGASSSSAPTSVAATSTAALIGVPTSDRTSTSATTAAVTPGPFCLVTKPSAIIFGQSTAASSTAALSAPIVAPAAVPVFTFGGASIPASAPSVGFGGGFSGFGASAPLTTTGPSPFSLTQPAPTSRPSIR